MELDLREMAHAFRQVMLEAGLTPPGDIVPGKLYRFPGVGKGRGNTAGRCMLFPDGLGGWFQDLSNGGEIIYWRAERDKPMTAEQRREHERLLAEARAAAERERKEREAKAAKMAWEILDAAKDDVAGHLYARRKKVPLGDLAKRGPWPQRGWKDAILVPLYDKDGQLTTVSAINEDGEKDLLAGGRKRGCFHPIGKFRGTTGPVLIGEGVATVAAACEATGYPGVVAVDAGNLEPVAKAVRELAPKAEIVILADDDQRPDRSGNPGIEMATRAAGAVGGRMALPGLGRKGDFWDVWHERGPEAVRRAIVRVTDKQSRVVAVKIDEFLSLELPPRKNLLDPWLPVQGLAMVYAYRGVGKTHFALGLAHACASGGQFLGWRAQEPVGVLYLDGEMPATVMQERLSAIIASEDKEPTAPFILVTPDLQPEGMPRIDTADGQDAIEEVLTQEIKLIVVDNISTLCQAEENKADAWTPVQAWVLKQRAKGRSVLLIHHAGKSGTQRGTSRREDVLDTVIALKRPANYQPDQGAVFEVYFEKARGLYGEDVKPIEARLTTDEYGRLSWTTKPVDESVFERVVSLLNEEMAQKDIAAELGIHKSTVSRHAKKAREMGLVQKDGDR